MWAWIWFIAFSIAFCCAVEAHRCWRSNMKLCKKLNDDLLAQKQIRAETESRCRNLEESLKDERSKHNDTIREANKTISGLKEKNAALLSQGQTIKDELDLANDKLERIRGEFYGSVEEAG